MNYLITSALVLSLLVIPVIPSFADDIEGIIESVDSSSKSIMVQGIIFHTTNSTDYDDGLNDFNDLNAGQKVEADFQYRDGKHFAKEIELDD